ncbi:hypothetical protein Bcep18194_C7149 [Burkholderia lata]|uniref:Uncharacterized protein n=1 Tax=Burkholderia lata (strain ATCC 17760 / DSM 23089 / LMG 22485 / NCIMB 9086 / R18194 / 383) TaxID=482957 RepID=Q39MX3_BURL3|nr:hypothetical protein Bcep18194_C7149 [Burkholderia lata]
MEVARPVTRVERHVEPFYKMDLGAWPLSFPRRRPVETGTPADVTSPAISIESYAKSGAASSMSAPRDRSSQEQSIRSERFAEK